MKGAIAGGKSCVLFMSSYTSCQIIYASNSYRILAILPGRLVPLLGQLQEV